MRRIIQHLVNPPQSEPLHGRGQVRNRAGGYVWSVDAMARLERFLILGTSSPTYYASAPELTQEAAEAVVECLVEDGVATVDRIVAVSTQGRAPRNDQALFALAMALKLGDDATRRHAEQAVPEVARTLSHLYQLAEAVQAFGGWGRSTRRAFASWLSADPKRLAYQAIKYRQREGWTLRDVLRKAHARPVSPDHDALFAWATQGTPVSADGALAQVAAFESARTATDVRELVALIEAHDLPREAVPTRFLGERAVWEALLQRMPMTALLRSLGKLSAVGLLTRGSRASSLVVERLRSAAVRKARLHPLALLVAREVYRSGKGVRGSLAWRAVPAVVSALEHAFYASFDAVKPSGKRHLLALDVSGSMGWSNIAGMPGITPRVGSAAMAMATLRAEPWAQTMAFSHRLLPLSLHRKDRLEDVLAKVDAMGMGGTDCALPMLWAARQRVEVDTFVVYTDNETWFGDVHPTVALEQYRQAMGRDAKLVVAGMVANRFSIADPRDPGMLDVVGFDTAAPKVMADFARQR